MEPNRNPAIPGSEGGLGAVQRRVGAAVVAALIGVFILFGVGLAQPDTLHNAAHDARHAFAFPCH
ncbi:MAG: CbtB-domain containing protein [Proteobacteria bacterium]|nr:CbtB-domain containing protein [Pseudomonadota bacterium]MCZ6743294.1 CbtB-domain containing protein [Alphaproteobacteria bacterium]